MLPAHAGLDRVSLSNVLCVCAYIYRKAHTRHELYLQLRRDIIDEQLHTDRDTAFVLAALAMQAECGDRPMDDGTSGAYDYFQPEHFLPTRHLLIDREDNRVRHVCAELHTTYAGMGRIEAEQEFIDVSCYH